MSFRSAQLSGEGSKNNFASFAHIIILGTDLRHPQDTNKSERATVISASSSATVAQMEKRFIVCPLSASLVHAINICQTSKNDDCARSDWPSVTTK